MSEIKRSSIKEQLGRMQLKEPLRISRQVAFKAPEPVAQSKALPSSEKSITEESGLNSHPVTGKKAEGFTAVPNSLLRICGQFYDGTDFMVYLHLFTYSYGFSKNTASMSHGQLERFTGATRNTIRKSLERLQAAGWISMIEDYECGRMSRKWKVKFPTTGEAPPEKPTGSKTDPVKNSPGEDITLRGSNSHPVTGVNFHPYKESSKTNLKETLSLKNPVLQKYFSEPMPFRKRESELKAFRELLETYQEDQVGLCVERLAAKGVPGSGDPCHSPMVFLSKAIARVLAEANDEREKREQMEVHRRTEAEHLAQVRREEQDSDAEFAEQEAEFLRSFPSPDEQALKIAEFAEKFPCLVRDGLIVRRLAIAEWMQNYSKQ